MLSAELVEDFISGLEKDEKELKQSEKREKQITQRFIESIKRLSMVL